MRKNILRLLNLFLGKIGAEITKKRPFPPWHQLRHLPQVGTLIDVGVGKGTQKLYSYFPNSYLFLVEPLEESALWVEQTLSTRDGEWVKVAVGETKHEQVFNVNERDIGKSGFFNPTEDHRSTQWKGDIISERIMPVYPLDELVKSRDLPKPYGLKIDVEGYELNVLKGSIRTLQACDFVLVETSLQPRFEGGAKFDDVYRFLNEQGFELGYLLSCNAANASGDIRMVDLAFTKQKSSCL